MSQDDYFLKAYNNKYVLSVHALIVFTIFCFLDDEKIYYYYLKCLLGLIRQFYRIFYGMTLHTRYLDYTGFYIIYSMTLQAR